jgi:hypothetical protein
VLAGLGIAVSAGVLVSGVVYAMIKAAVYLFMNLLQ